MFVSYTETLAPKTCLELLDDAKEIVDVIPTYDDRGEFISCHSMVRYVASELNKSQTRLRSAYVLDGHFMGRWEHSWIGLGHPEQECNWIIDVYPIAVVGGPLLINVDRMSPMRNQFVVGQMPSGIVDKVNAQVKHLERWVSEYTRKMCGF